MTASQLGSDIEDSTLVWVRQEMVFEALEASGKLQDDWSFAEEIPFKIGMMGCEVSLPKIAFTSLTPSVGMRDLNVDAISWIDFGGYFDIFIFTRDILPFSAKFINSELHPVASFRIPTDRKISEEAIEDICLKQGIQSFQIPYWQSIIYTLGAMFIMAKNPLAVETKATGGGEVKWRGDYTRPPITIINVRPPRVEAVSSRKPKNAAPKPKTVKHAVRWIVSGHFRQQPYGEGRSFVKTIYIEPYIKGPEGFPLRKTEKVFVWRRGSFKSKPKLRYSEASDILDKFSAEDR